MRAPFLLIAALAGLAPLQSAVACPPPLPGWVPPTEDEQLRAFARASSDIVYAVVTRDQSADGLYGLKILHVYKGTRKAGETVEARIGFDYPVPVCAGMMGPPPPRSKGAYGVAAFSSDGSELYFIPEAQVNQMIAEGLIRSARAR